MRLIAFVIPCAALLWQTPLHAQAAAIANATNLWVSGGLGSGDVKGNIYLIGSTWFSAGPVIAGVRKMSSGPYDYGSQHQRDNAKLIGLRTTHRRFVALGALGRSNVSHRYECNFSCTINTDWSQKDALAYSFQFLINYQVLGIGIEQHGARGALPYAYSARVVTVQFGWFGL